jgi:isopentenyl phosphate kinase
MKFHSSKRQIMNNYYVLNCGNEISILKQYQEAIAYTTRVEGWAADIYYTHDNIVVCTGYSAFGHYKVKFDLIKKYEDKARQVYYSDLDFNIKSSKIKKLLNQFAAAAKKEAEAD